MDAFAYQVENNYNKKKMITIIVPVYNKELYLRDCVESVLSQSIDEWELILVDDGSTDKSGEICDEYASKDSRIKVFHKENSGQFETRMMGIVNAKGVYCTGLDADDTLEKDCIEKLCQSLNDGDIDVLAWNMRTVMDGREISVIASEKYGEFSTQDYLSDIVKASDHSFCNKAIKTDILKTTDYSTVPVHLRDSEDYMLIIPAICRTKKIFRINETLYNYRQTDGISNRLSHKRIMEYLTAFQYVKDQMEKYGMLTEEIKASDGVNVLQLLAENIKFIYKSGEMTREEIGMIQNDPYYISIKKYEKRKNLSVDQYVVMKLFRCGYYRLLRTVYKLKG